MIIFSFHITPILLAKIPQYFHFTKAVGIFLVLKASFYNLNDYLTHFAFSSPQKVRHTLFLVILGSKNNQRNAKTN